MTDAIDHIVFDIGKVLIHYDPNLPFSRLIPDAAERQWFFDTICTHEWNLEQDRGRTWEDAESLLIADHPEREEQIRNFRKHWTEMVPHAYDGTVEILKELLAQGRDVTMLTNFASDTFAEAKVKFPFLTLARGVTVSGDIFLIKPDVAIYEKHAHDFDLTPAKTLFIDDNADNVAGAKTAGWQADQFFDAQTLRADLARLGVL